MNNKGKNRVLTKIRIGVFVVLTLCFMTKSTSFRPRTIYYMPYAYYVVNYTGNVFQSSWLIFLGKVRSTICTENNSASIQGWINVQFTNHIERFYQSRLGVRHSWQERIGYWRWENGEQTLQEMYQRIASRSPNNTILVNDFFLTCSNTANVQFRTGYYRNTAGDSGKIQNLGNGRYRFELWQGTNPRPNRNNWYNRGTGTTGRDGLIHSVNQAVAGHPYSNYTFEGYWQIINAGKMKLVKYRNYITNTRPGPNEGWIVGGPTYTLVTN